MGKALDSATFDPSEHLDDAESQIALLNDAFETRDSRAVVHAIGILAHGVSDLSKTTGIGRSSLYKALEDGANPALGTLMKVLDGLKVDLRAATSAAA